MMLYLIVQGVDFKREIIGVLVEDYFVSKGGKAREKCLIVFWSDANRL